MPDIVLTTLNAKYIHAAFGLRYLLANLGPLRTSATIVEFDINQRPVDIAEALQAEGLPPVTAIENLAPAEKRALHAMKVDRFVLQIQQPQYWPRKGEPRSSVT